jgi:hypothetical protein
MTDEDMPLCVDRVADLQETGGGVGRGFVKRRARPGRSRICKVWGEKVEAGQGFGGLGFEGRRAPARKRASAPLRIPRVRRAGRQAGNLRAPGWVYTYDEEFDSWA